MQNTDSLSQILSYFPEPLRGRLAVLSPQKRAGLREIRLRAGRAVRLYHGGTEEELSGFGCASPQLLQEILRAVCEDSIHSYARELREGFITLRGGHRVGFCGTAVRGNGTVETVKYVSGFNFRLARSVYGCADALYQSVCADRLCNLLIIGAPGSGKTTVLRDLCRQLGNRVRVAVSDERGELAAVYHGLPQNDVGLMTDVLDGYPKGEGLMTAIRVLSPQVLVCDEISGAADTDALLCAVHAGVSVVATAHAGSIEEVHRRPDLAPLFAADVFSSIALLGTGSAVGTVVQMKRRTQSCGSWD